MNILVSWIANGMDFICTKFMAFYLPQSAGEFTKLFPVVSAAYAVFKGIGFGLVAVFAIVGLIKFFIPESFGGRPPLDTPVGIILKTALATLLISVGNYGLEFILDLSKIPTGMFNNLDISQMNPYSWKYIFSNIAPEQVELEVTGFAAPFVLLQLVLIALIGWNVFKLILEVAERYMLVYVMLFTSPPFFAMVTTYDTLNSFKKWIKMFIGGCVMLMLSSFFMKVVLSAFYGMAARTLTSQDTVSNLLLIFAMCKIAQKADEHLNSLGLGVGTTGKPLLDDIVVSTKQLRVMMNNGKSGNSVLGNMADKTMNGYGLAGIAKREVSPRYEAFKEARENGASVKEAWSDAKQAHHDTESAPMANRAAASVYSTIKKRREEKRQNREDDAPKET